MTLIVLDADLPGDIPSLVNTCWQAFSNPHQRHFDVFNPVHGTGPNARTEAMNSAIERTKRRNENDDTEHWQKVIDTDTDEIVGAALWNFYASNPYEDYTPMDVYWWPKGPKRDYVNELMRQYDVPLVEMAARPHILLKILFTKPDYRNRGVASLLIESGIRKANEKQVDIWLSNWGQATPFYQKHGFKVMREVRTQPMSDDPPPEWQELDAKLQPLVKWVMRKTPEPESQQQI